jgi:hypothetical protein
MFQTPVDIGNRALQHCGAILIDPTLGFTENSRNSGAISFPYGKVKRAELRRNVWQFATRRAALRPIDTNTMLLAPTMWESGTTYFEGSIVSDQNNFLWISNNLGNQPQNSTAWDPYFKPLTVSLYDSSQIYFAGELVYTAPGDGTYKFLQFSGQQQCGRSVIAEPMLERHHILSGSGGAGVPGLRAERLIRKAKPYPTRMGMPIRR